MTVTVRLTGFKELEKELAKLSKGMARGALRRAGISAMAPMAELAARLAPKDTGELQGSIIVSTKAKGAGADIGKSEFGKALKAGLGRAAAVSAMRAARRAAGGAEGLPNVELFMGPTVAGSRDAAIKRIVQEFGSINQPGQPYMRPAWDRDRGALLERLEAELWAELKKSVARAEARAARAAAAARG